ncbi:MAG: hypothetical protein J0M18_00640 [Ignavibacteria bacterium]|jgi:hypothetical protein|nr:hypothetical protein [Ignavibacteria bacterium]
MNLETSKIELIDWILSLKDSNEIKKLLDLKNTESGGSKKRKPGFGKNIFTFIADDFNEPLKEFSNYSK